jgi:fructokinase
MQYPEVVTFGEVLWDLLPSGKVLGGAPGNVAYRLVERGINAAVVSRIGADEIGKELLAAFLENGISCDYIQTEREFPTGTVNVTLNSEGNPHFDLMTNVAYDRIEFNKELIEVAQQARVICFGTLVQRSQKTADALFKLLAEAKSATKVLDINLRAGCYSQDSVNASLEFATILKVNESEVLKVGELLGLDYSTIESFAIALFDRYRNIETVLVTLGEAGVEAFMRDGRIIKMPTRKVVVQDTIGSGDAFTAGFIYGKIKGASIEK